HQRMIAAKKAEESAKEFLVGKNTVVNAGIPRNAVMPEQKPRVGASAAERYPLVDPVPAPAPVTTPASVSTQEPASKSGSHLSPESLSFRDALMKEARIKESYSKDSFIEQLKQEK